MMLRGDKVGLRILERNEDIERILEGRSDRKVMGEFCPPQLVKKNDIFDKNKKPHFSQYVIFELKYPDIVVGEISFSRIEAERSVFELGSWIFPEFRRKGYCKEAILILLDYLFLRVNTNRIQCQTHIDNTASINLIQKVGFQKEGVLRQSIFLNGKWADIMIFSILRREWKEPKYLKC